MIRRLKIFTFVCVLTSSFAYAQNDNLTVQSLMGVNVDTILRHYLMGEGVTLSNGMFNNQSGAVTSEQIGTFNRNGFTSFPLATGLILATGNIQVAEGPNTSSSMGDNTDVVDYVDSMLANLATELLFNCASLDFDFQANSDTFAFRYVFASEEYCEYVNSEYNDIFAFFLTGEDPVTHVQVTKNVAIIPGSVTAANPDGIPVAINNVNHGYHSPSWNGPGDNPSYPEFFIHNNSFEGVQYDGYTTAFSAGANILACHTYHMKLSVGDVGDNAYDSGVFLEEHSFESFPDPYLSMSGTYCQHDDILFNFVAGNVDSVYLVTVSGDTLREQPFIVHDVGAADMGCYYLWAKKHVDCDGLPWMVDSVFITIENPCIPAICDGPEMCAGGTLEFPCEYESVEGPWVNFVNDTLFTLNPPASLPHDTLVAYRFSVFGESGCHLDTLVGVQYYAVRHADVYAFTCEEYTWNDVVYYELGDYSVTGTSAVGCDSITVLHLAADTLSMTVISLTEDFCEDMSAELSVITDVTDYVWSTGEQAPTIKVTIPGLYSVSGSYGACQTTAYIVVPPCEIQLILPNAITPSKSDGLNEYFSIPEKVQGNIAEFEIFIFNRWGEMVFYSTDKGFKWYGDYKGKTYYETTYNYVVRFKDLSGYPYTVKGSITVL